VSLVGKNIDAYCTKCKLLLTHVVLSEVDGVVSKVECKTCGSQHKYRKGVPGKKTAVKAARSTSSGRVRSSSTGRKKTVNEAALLWEVKSRDMQPDVLIRTYQMKDTYRSDEVILHPVFGLGFVEKVMSETRMQVLFKEEVKLMVMNTAR
jgi:hypothetical protein